jgi:tetratricopeptide (TPR) repeat protein
MKYNYEIINDYLHGLLDKKMSKEISELLRTDETARSIAQGILLLEKKFKGDENAVESYLENFGQRQLKLVAKEAQPKTFTKTVWFRMAAALLLLVAVGALVRLMMSTPDLETLVNQELAQAYPVSNLVRSDGAESYKEKGYQLYSEGNYAGASKYFDKALEENKSDASVIFYNGLCHLYAGSYEKANLLLSSEVIAESRYVEQAQWFGAIAYIKSNDKSNAIKILKVITRNEKHFKYEVAFKLMKELEQS